ncbi:MAG: extracellular solute-binding protein [Rhodospirillaceae bacterium]|nr:extracellular solute-binding protein [Rhodospirillaceae bacterium]
MAAATSKGRWRTQPLQLVRLYRREHGRQLRERVQRQGPLDTYDGNESLEAKLVVGNTGYDIVFPSSSFFARQIKTGIYQPLDRSKLTNWSNLDQWVLQQQASYDPGNVYAAPYMWGTNGFTYNLDMIQQRMPDAPLTSLRMLFDPEVVSKFQDCGVSFLDSPEDVFPLALAYMGKDPTSQNPDDIVAATEMLMKVRPYIKLFDSQLYLNDLPNSERCIAMTWSGDYAVAALRAEEAGVQINLAYSVPAEGSNLWFDAMLIPKDAPNPENALLFINYMMRPDVIADCTNYIGYANGNQASKPLISPDILNDPAIYPDAETQKRMFPERRARRGRAARHYAGVDQIEDRSVTGGMSATVARTGELSS